MFIVVCYHLIVKNSGEKTMTYDGIVEISNEDYHSSDGFSKSALMTLKHSRTQFYKDYILGQREHNESDDMLLGSLTHALILEPDTVKQQYYVYKHISRSTKDGKAQALELESAQKDGLTLVKQDIYEQAILMSDAILTNPIAKNIIDSAQKEQSIYWTDEETGLLFKSRPDLLGSNISGDIKTCKSIGNYGFSKSCLDYGYFLQAAMCKIALESVGQSFERFVFICAAKNEPYDVVNYVLDEQAIEYGINQFKHLSGMLRHELELNDWLRPVVETLTVPKWAEWN